MQRRELETMPFAKVFETENGNEELCNATGYKVNFEETDYDEHGSSNWWNEYVDNDGNLHYGR